MSRSLDPDDGAPAARPALEYAKPQGPSRRQFNLLLLLVFINTLMFAAFVCLPAVSPIVKQTWADYQARKAEKQKQQQRQAMLQQVKTYVAPANQVIYEEDPAEIQKLFAASRDWTTGRVSNRSAPGFPSSELAPILRNAPLPLAQLQSTAQDLVGRPFAHAGIVFLHARNDPSGREHLVCVTVSSQINVDLVGRENASGLNRFVYDLKRSIYLTSYAVPADGLPRTQTIMYLEEPGDHGRLAYLISPDKASVPTLSGGEPQTLHRSILRILAGQPDPEDATHFMIPYVLNGKPGVIDGYIRPDGRVVLEPREGRFLRWSNASNYTWELSSVPTTQPIR